jgi:RPA family protein
MIEREVGWRIFAGEFNDSTHVLSSDEERSPSYLISPLGAKINRVFAVGVITDLENLGSPTEPLWRARLRDPTGTFFISAGLCSLPLSGKCALILLRKASLMCQ